VCYDDDEEKPFYKKPLRKNASLRHILDSTDNNIIEFDKTPVIYTCEAGKWVRFDTRIEVNKAMATVVENSKEGEI